MSTTTVREGPAAYEVERARELFGLGPRPTRREIVTAWRAAVRLTHPDVVEPKRCAAAQRLLQRINESRDILLEAAANADGGHLTPSDVRSVDRRVLERGPSPVLLAALEASRVVDGTSGVDLVRFSDADLLDPLLLLVPPAPPDPPTPPSPPWVPWNSPANGYSQAIYPKGGNGSSLPTSTGTAGFEAFQTCETQIAPGPPSGAAPPEPERVDAPAPRPPEPQGQPAGRADPAEQVERSGVRGRCPVLLTAMSLLVVCVAILGAILLWRTGKAGSEGPTTQAVSAAASVGGPETALPPSSPSTPQSLADRVRSGDGSPSAAAPPPVTETPEPLVGMFVSAVASGDLPRIRAMLAPDARTGEAAEAVDLITARIGSGATPPAALPCASSLDGTWARCSLASIQIDRDLELSNTPAGWRLVGWMP